MFYKSNYLAYQKYTSNLPKDGMCLVTQAVGIPCAFPYIINEHNEAT